MSIRASKQAVMMGQNVPLPEAMMAQREYPAVRAMVASADYVEGPKAFAEKRPPRWQGK
jgi:crotonobetainyl-CoA hydratase